ncbi:MAG: ABC transporter ATP-binding protein [Blastopirellula sp.]|nr:MAG: ABC transporter ATP-binding protein [Blastopirellula sp.]
MLELRDVQISSGSFTLENLSLSIAPGEYTIVMGQTGSGKTTLLEGICGLRPVNAGSIKFNGKDVTNLAPQNRGFGYVPQDLALFRTMTVYENMAYALKARKAPISLIDSSVNDLAKLLEIEELLPRSIAGLSGGQAQRVALGRALAFEPLMLLLDEPLSALDEKTHAKLCELLKQVQAETQVTVLHVTHDLQEAKRLGDRIYQFDQGQLTLI